MLFSQLIRNFAHKFTKFLRILQIKMQKSEELELKFYYDKLRKEDQSKFIGYLMWKLGFTYNGIWNRINDRTELSVPERMAINNIMTTEEWKR